MAKKSLDAKQSDSAFSAAFTVTDELESILKSVENELPDISDDESASDLGEDSVTIFKRKPFVYAWDDPDAAANGHSNGDYEEKQNDDSGNDQSRAPARNVASKKTPILNTSHDVSENQLDAALSVLKRRNEAGLERPINQTVINLVDTLLHSSRTNGSRMASSAAHADVVHRLAMLANEFMPEGGTKIDISSLNLHSGSAIMKEPKTRDAAVQCRDRSFIPARTSRRYVEMSKFEPEKLDGNRCSMGTSTDPEPDFDLHEMSTGFGVQTELSSTPLSVSSFSISVSTGTSIGISTQTSTGVSAGTSTCSTGTSTSFVREVDTKRGSNSNSSSNANAKTQQRQVESMANGNGDQIERPRRRAWELYVSNGHGNDNDSDSDSD